MRGNTAPGQSRSHGFRASLYAATKRKLNRWVCRLPEFQPQAQIIIWMGRQQPIEIGIGPRADRIGELVSAARVEPLDIYVPETWSSLQSQSDQDGHSLH